MSRLAKARRLVVNGNTHLAKIGRPGTPKRRDAATLAKRQRETLERERERIQRGARR